MRSDRANWRERDPSHTLTATNGDRVVPKVFMEKMMRRQRRQDDVEEPVVKQPVTPRKEPMRFFKSTGDKLSVGVACCRIMDGRPEILLVRKRYTYAYNLFVHGKYNSNSNEALINLFNGMTLDEKHDIASLNFAQIWYRVWLNGIPRGHTHFLAKNKFESAFVVDGGVRLRKLISKSTHAQLLWEIPKGRKKNKAESDIHCAIREFSEETGVPKKSYKIFPAKKTYSYIDAGVKYTNQYWFAFTRHKFEPKIEFRRQDQIDEISDIRWMDIVTIRHIEPRLANVVQSVFNYIKKHASA